VWFTIQVVDGNSGNPISGATVLLDGSYVGTTDYNGNVQVTTSYPPADHNYYVSANGYQSTSGDVTIGSNSGGYFTISLYSSSDNAQW
jgi:hypothetical protein